MRGPRSMTVAAGSLVFTDCIGTLTAHQRLRPRACRLCHCRVACRRITHRPAVHPPQFVVVPNMLWCWFGKNVKVG
jgi:hypothetical protein